MQTIANGAKHVMPRRSLHLPVMNAHGVGFSAPSEPFLMHALSDLMGAENASVDKMAPIVGHT